MLVGNTLLAGSAIGPAPFEVDTAEGDSKEGGPGGGAYLGCCQTEATGRVRPGREYTKATIGTEPWVRGGAPKLDNWEGRQLWKRAWRSGKRARIWLQWLHEQLRQALEEPAWVLHRECLTPTNVGFLRVDSWRAF